MFIKQTHNGRFFSVLAYDYVPVSFRAEYQKQIKSTRKQYPQVFGHVKRRQNLRITGKLARQKIRRKRLTK